MLIAKEVAIMVPRSHNPGLLGSLHDFPKSLELPSAGEVAGVTDVNKRIEAIFYDPSQEILTIEVELDRTNGCLHDFIGKPGTQDLNWLPVNVVKLIISNEHNPLRNVGRRRLTDRNAVTSWE